LACTGGLTGSITYAKSFFGTFGWGGRSTRRCNSNSVRGLSALSSFTYYVTRDIEGPTTGILLMASAFIIDAVDNSVVASVDISSQLWPVEFMPVPVTAKFASVVALDKLRTYRLAFCRTSERTNDLFNFEVVEDATPNLGTTSYCDESPGETCPSGGGSWSPSSDTYIFKTIIAGGCTVPSVTPSPSVSPRAMVACAGDNTGSLSYANTPAEIAYWGGIEAATCVSNTVVGLGTLSNFTYYLRRDEGAASSVKASAFVVDSAANSVVASVNISSLLSTTVQAQAAPVMARFASEVPLNKRKAYKLAFCLTAPLSVGIKYNFEFTSELDVIEVCTPSNTTSCPTGGGAWSSGDSRVLRTDLNGGCIEPSPSRTPSHTPSNSRTPSNSPSKSPTPSNSPSNSQTPSSSPSNSRTPSRTPTRSPSPTTAPMYIEACTGSNSGTLTYAGGNIEQGNYGAIVCFSNTITGLSALSSFTYYIRRGPEFVSLTAVGAAIDAADNSVIASVNISGLATLVPSL
jgi:hypothetical protein